MDTSWPTAGGGGNTLGHIRLLLNRTKPPDEDLIGHFPCIAIMHTDLLRFVCLQNDDIQDTGSFKGRRPWV